MDAPWSATSPSGGWKVTWSPVAPHVASTDENLLQALEQALDGSTLMVTPTGPWITADPADALAVRVVLWDLSSQTDVVLTDQAPEVPGIPPGAVG